MSGANLIFMLQCFVAFAWGVPLIRKWTAVRRVWAGRSHGDDLPRAVIWFIAAAMQIGILRWLLFPQSIRVMSSAEIFSWAGVYVLWIVAAGAVTLVYWERSHG